MSELWEHELSDGSPAEMFSLLSSKYLLEHWNYFVFPNDVLNTKNYSF